MEETKDIRVILIFEIIGRPPKHLVDSLGKIIEELDKEKGVTVISKNIKKPSELKDKKGFYTTFAEVEIEVEEILYLAILMFKYMPAHIEIIYPELIALTNNGWSDILSELARRLHGYDEVARVLQMERAILERKLQESLFQGQKPKLKKKKSVRKKVTKKIVIKKK